MSVLRDSDLRLHPRDSTRVMAAKVALKAGRRLGHEDNPEMVEIVVHSARSRTAPEAADAARARPQ